MANLARFKINGTASSPGGFDATVAQVLTLVLEASSSLVSRVTFEVYDDADSASPLCSKGAPELSLVGGTTGQKVDAATPASSVTVTMPGSGVHSWIVRCTVNGGVDARGLPDEDLVYERMVSIRSTSGRRKITASEGTQYESSGWAGAQNDDVDADAGGGFDSFFGSGSDGNLTASSGVTTLTKPTYYDTVTLTGTAQIDTAGWPLYIKTFHAENAPARAIFRKGNDGVAGTTAGAVINPLVGSYLGGGGGGGSGGAGGTAGNNGTGGSQANTVSTGTGGVGGAGGKGGNGNSGKTGGAAPAIRNPTLRTYQEGFERLPFLLSSTGGNAVEVISGGTGGGGGGGGGGASVTNGGGDGRGGGGGGPVLEVWIGELITGGSTPAALIDSYGGGCGSAAGTPSNGGGSGGGGGGGGGATRVFIGKRTGSAVTNLICANGANGGPGGAANGGTAGDGGQAGGGGTVLAGVLESGSCLRKTHEVGGGPAASGTTGGVASVWGVTL